MDTNTRDEMTFSGALLHFFQAPFRLRTYTNLLYLALAFPLGLLYFLFLSVGIPLGLGLTLVWIGIPILALVFAGSWGLAAMERQLAIHALGAPVPPMSQPAVELAQTPQPVWERVKAFFSNPVTWKGMAFLLLKLPLGIVSFVSIIFMLTLSLAFLATPFVWQWADYEVDGVILLVDSWGEAWLFGLFGLGLLFVSLNLLNGLALVWRWMATFLLGSERFAHPAPPSSPVLTDGMALA